MNNSKYPLKLLVIAISAVFLTNIAESKPQSGIWGACKISPLEDFVYNQGQIETDGVIHISSDRADLDPKTATLYGNVVVIQDKQKFTSDSLHLDREQNALSAREQLVRYASSTTVLEGNIFEHLINEDKTTVYNSSYYLKNSNEDGQGKANMIKHDQPADQTYLTDASYSTCPVGSEVWSLKARDLTIDHIKGRGVAKGARFAILGAPVMYTPYFSFPINDERHSGFLFPNITLNKGSGLAIRIPYYFNIAPNFDATATVGLFSNRGVLLGAEARYLNTWQNSILSGEYLPNDREYNKKDRWSIFFDQQLYFTEKLYGSILFQKVSDDDYIKDLDDAIGLLSKTNLERNAELTYAERNWSMTFRMQHFQVIDRDVIPDDPYARLPQIVFSGSWNLGGFTFGLDAEAVRFNTKITDRLDRPKMGDRFDITPSISYRLENSWAFIEPRARFRYTNYNLRYKHATLEGFTEDDFNKYYAEVERNDHRERSFDRALPILSLDTGLFLERKTNFKNLFGGGEYTQTLEPRLFYLYVPYRKQSHIPIFDTSEISPSYRSLFKSNDFGGADRQSNANQLTTALTSRFINDESGREMLRLSFGQIQYFETPRITLGKDRDDLYKKKRSEFFLEGETEVYPNVFTNVTWQWSPKEKKTSRATLDLRYQPEARKIINVGYRYNRNYGDTNNSIDQIDLTSFWELNNNWAVVGRYNYSINTNRMVDSYAGFEYNDCCVSTRLVARYHRDHPTSETKQWKAYLQFELKGLGNFGQDAKGLWHDTITGYNPF